MRAIKKSVDGGGYYLDCSNQSLPKNSKEAESRWGSFSHKSALTQILLDEQYGLCAYSEIRFDEFDLGSHIEHIEPKSLNPSRTFDYSNMVLNALSGEGLKKRSKDDCFGGHAKLDEYDANLFVSCLQSDCASYFVYLSNGHVEPANTLTAKEREKAKYTIALLNLDCDYLVTERKKWLDELDELIDDYLFEGLKLEELASIYLIPVNDNIPYSFFTASRQHFGQIAEQIIEFEAPELI